MYEAVRRLVDILAAGCGVIMLSPLAVPLIIALRMTGEGRIFYNQARLGYGNKPFKILKFATMLADSADMPGGGITFRNDPRLTPLGGFLRKSKLNELPQLWNVLVGDMTIVGPRPLVSLDVYPPAVQAAIAKSRPGVTGIGSLVFRDEEAYVSATRRDPTDFYRQVIFPYKGQLELWYFRRKSPATDLKILVLTAWSLFSPSSTLVFRWFSDLPILPDELRMHAPPGDAEVSDH